MRPRSRRRSCVNPDAPKGGEVKLVAIGTFDNLNPFIATFSIPTWQKPIPTTAIGQDIVLSREKATTCRVICPWDAATGAHSAIRAIGGEKHPEYPPSLRASTGLNPMIIHYRQVIRHGWR